MKIALCQINPTVGSFDYNRDLILKNYVESINRNADIVVFPELVITGYPPQDLLWEDGFIHQNLHILDTIAAQSTIPIISTHFNQHAVNDFLVFYHLRRTNCKPLITRFKIN